MKWKIMLVTTCNRIKNDIKSLDVFLTEYETRMPKPSQSFIEEFCEAGEIFEVDVEYEKIYEDVLEGNEFILRPCGYKLKTNPDNTIIIHLIEDKMYNKIQVGNKCRDIIIAMMKYILKSDSSTTFDTEKWIEENL